MSEYWVSKKKYFCKYCEIYIADDVPSRQQHENGLRHQGNRERFIRNIYKTSEKKKKDLEEEKRELARVEQAAHAAFAQDVSAGHARPGITSVPAAGVPSTSRKPPAKPSNPFTNYTTAESLGYTDPDAEREAAEAERRRMQGVVGEWQVVTPPPPPPIPCVEEGHVEFPATSSDIPLKREAEVYSDDDYDRHSKLRKKTVRAGLGEVYDPGIIPIKVKKKEESTEGLKVEERDVTASSVEDEQPKPAGPPRWIKVEWKRPEEPPEGSLDGGETGQRSQDEAKKEEIASAVPAEPPVKVESEGVHTKVKALKPEVSFEMSSQPAGGSMFKKRRMPTSATTKGRRNF
ncbi:hypothetical protein APHAL10511_000186 [Amanita phalloides]|nr:hypothetical protein APHAL10511_000186 [Amanita phalloides]